MPHKIISVEGNIAAGKSKLVSDLKNIATNNNIRTIYIQEPVSEWSTIRNKDNINILTLFYNDQHKYAFSFQMMAYISRLVSIKKAVESVGPDENCIIICERSVHTDRHVFAKMLYDDGKIEDINFEIYLRWFDEFVNDYPIEAIIYIPTPPKLCAERVKIRNRLGEDISIEYLECCHQYHVDWLEKSTCKILTIDPYFTSTVKGQIDDFIQSLELS
jgi:deoxyadenosine/deoxycytidine kinase